MADIALCTLNARYIHASLGLRYLRSNLGVYRERSALLEFTTKKDSSEIVAEILKHSPRIVGFGIYIWNTVQTLAVIRELKLQAPQMLVVAGGPEISFETESQEIFKLIDFVFPGEADLAFNGFAHDYFSLGRLPATKIVKSPLPEIKAIEFPYSEYTDEDIRHRTIYVEASRGCAFKCEFCLSSLDTAVRNFAVESFLMEMEKLIERGARQFKFVDRTFNLKPVTSAQILTFFLEHSRRGLFLHFEMVPDRLPDELKDLIRKFPPGSLQFEIGIQTWSEEVSSLVSRRQNRDKICENFKFLREHTHVHTHADLIVGLPGETFASFAAGFNNVAELKPDEIQVGLLKRLKGTPIIRHDENFQMVYSPEAPFQILQTRDLSLDQIERLKVFADFWNLIVNSGRFSGAWDAQRASGQDPFHFFFDLAQDLFVRFGRTHSIHLRDLEFAIQAEFFKRGLSVTWGGARKNHSLEIGLATPSRQQRHRPGAAPHA